MGCLAVFEVSHEGPGGLLEDVAWWHMEALRDPCKFPDTRLECAEVS